MGHIVVYRNVVLNLMGMQPVTPERIKTLYERGSKMMTDAEGAEDLTTLLKFFDESQLKIMEGAAKTYPTDITEKLIQYGFHEGYHVGQVAIMRKLIGKEGAIK